MGAGLLNVDLKGVLDNAEGVGKGISSILTGLRTMITGKTPIDPTKLAEIAGELEKLQSLQQTNQVDINKLEAVSPSWWNSGWRPYIGWILGTSMGIYFIPMFAIGTYLWARQVIASGIWVAPPDLGIGQVISLLGGMLGFGTFRMLEKKWGVQGDH
jgi:hypothetical protein